MADAAEKTHPPSRRRLAELCRRGDVPRSRELAAAAVLVAATVLFGLGVDELAGVVVRGSAGVFANATDADAARALAVAVAKPLAWLLAALFAAGLAGGYLQVGPLTAFGRLQPRLDRLNAADRLAEQFSPGRVAGELLKTSAGVLVIGVIGFLVVRSNLPLLRAGPIAETPFLAAGLRDTVRSLLQLGVLAFLFLGAIDFVWQRHRFFARHRMSAREVRREAKDDAGDPLVRSAQRRAQDDASLERVLDDVRRATVVVLGDDAVAAVRFAPPTDDAPRVVAGGRGERARRILAAADAAGVPVRRDAALAVALAGSPPEVAIAPDLYPAVAAALSGLR